MAVADKMSLAVMVAVVMTGMVAAAGRVSLMNVTQLPETLFRLQCIRIRKHGLTRYGNGLERLCFTSAYSALH